MAEWCFPAVLSSVFFFLLMLSTVWFCYETIRTFFGACVFPLRPRFVVVVPKVHKTTAVRVILAPDAGPGSNDRARRVKRYGRGNSGRLAAKQLTAEVAPEDQLWTGASIGQPFATLVQITSGTFALCIFILNRPVDPAAGAAQRLCGIRARLRAAGDGEARVDAAGGSAFICAGTGWFWDGGKTHGSKEVKVPATLAIPLNPAMNENLDKVVFSLESLTAVLATLEMLIEKSPDANSKIVKSSTTSVDGLPYHPSLEAGTRTPQPRGSLKCRICRKGGINILDMRHHVGAHVLHAQVGCPHDHRY